MDYFDAGVFYLEDEILVSLDVQQILTDIGMRDVTVAYSADEADRMVGAGRFDVALLDINLGKGQTSFDVARQLKRDGTTIVFTTGYNAVEIPEEFRDDRILEKPVVLADVKRALEEVLEGPSITRAAE